VTHGSDDQEAWTAEGRRLGDKLSEYNAIVVLGDDAVAAASVALGLAQAQQRERRVAVADLFGDAPPLQELLTSDDPHGIVDSFVYGVSLNKVAQPVVGSEQLFVLPTGTDAPDYDELLPHPRWRRLSGGFREMGALFLVVAPASAPRIAQLVEATDGAILVGGASPSDLPVQSVIASVHLPLLAADPQAPAAPAAPEPPAASQAAAAPPPRRFRTDAIIGAFIALTVVAFGGWLAWRPLAQSILPAAERAHRSGDTGAAAIVPVRFDSASVPEGVAVPEISDPGDAAGAAVWAVQLMAANTRSGAILRLQQDGKRLPAATFAPVLESGAEWSRVIAGAFTDSLGADSLLVRLRREQVLDSAHGTVVRVPFAFLMDSGVTTKAVDGMVSEFVSRGQPVYALRQPDGTANLYAGAFQTPAQASLFAQSLRAADIVPVLVYRHGRQF
jgi:hypothetical protein